MSAATEEVLRLLELLPEDTSLEDIPHHIYVRQKIDHKLRRGAPIPEEEFDQRSASEQSRPPDFRHRPHMTCWEGEA